MEGFWDWYKRSQRQAQLENIPLVELDWLISGLTHLDKLALRLERGSLDGDQIKQLEHLWQERIIKRTPVQYLVGCLTWRDLELNVTPAVLIPRPETELIIDLAKDLAGSSSFSTNQVWVDLGTGSGAIALGLAQTFSDSAIYAVDCSGEALAIAKANAIRNNLSARIKFHHGKWFEPLESLKSSITGLVSNPPYIPTAEMSHLQIEVTQHEPHLALDGGVDGLDALRHLVDVAPEYLIPGGCWIVEVMAGQTEAVRSLLAANGNYTKIQTHRDQANIERFVSAMTVQQTESSKQDE
jgi:release factor glutamine methyltransferase